MLELIKKKFQFTLCNSIVMLYYSIVRSHLEYANVVWNPHKERLIKDLQWV